ncbi:YceI family protein [Aliamphritea ceti]|uniref:YceI family protein n=1 Tax=Aliamphritea ceti TaxID=1524258 RepID=UPI0021C34713|nr:YceI family protein [Aliamphritea ceti]
MKKTLALCSLGLVMALPATAADYEFDKAHTNVQFGISHNGLSNFLGQFQDFTGKFDIDEKDLTKSSFDVIIKTASVDTDVPALDDHLKNADFFDVNKYPEMRFKSERIVQISADKYAVEGQLTMLDKTLPVTLDTRLNFQGRHPLADFFPAYDTQYLGFSATASIRRTEFGMMTYAPMLADQVNITLEAELKRKQ